MYEKEASKTILCLCLHEKGQWHLFLNAEWSEPTVYELFVSSIPPKVINLLLLFLSHSRLCRIQPLLVAVDEVFFRAPSKVGDRVVITSMVNNTFSKRYEA